MVHNFVPVYAIWKGATPKIFTIANQYGGSIDVFTRRTGIAFFQWNLQNNQFSYSFTISSNPSSVCETALSC